VLCEPGSTADGRLDTMYALMDVAVAAGCTTFKPQFTSSPERLCARRHAPAATYLASYRKLAWPMSSMMSMSRHARHLGLRFVVSVYLPEDAAIIAPYVDALKISSFEHESLDLVQAAHATGKPVYISTGMGTVASVVTASRQAAALFHCVSRYPTPLDALNLAAIRTMAQWAAIPIGYSDHSADVRVGAWAVGYGAELVEVHMRLDDCDPANLDYAVSLPPAALATYVTNVRDAERARGDGVKRPQAAEAPMQAYRVTREGPA
jgi:N-acetylneuraminate synthase/N,N'-diacetyllegionaminate synthase